MSYTDANGLTKINDTKWFDPTADIGKTEIELSIGLGVDFDFGFKKGKEDSDGMSKIHLSVTVSIEAGVKVKFVPSLVGNLFDKHHNCVFCLEGSLSVFVGGKATIKIKIVSNSLKFQWDAIDLSASVHLGDIYFSIGPNGMKLGFGVCPNIAHKVTFTVYSEDGYPVLGAIVSTTTGYCDADGDKKFEEKSMRTDEKGQVVFYFAKGKHQIIAKKDGLGIVEDKFEIIEEEKELNLTLFNVSEYNGHYYKVYDSGVSWNEANDYCKSLGGHLVSITNSSENSFVYSIIKNSEKTVYWLGGYLEKSWKWTTGESFSYTKWGYYKPDNLTGEETYLQMYRIAVNNNRASTWNDERPNGDPESSSPYSLNNTGFVCEWEAIPRNIQITSYRMSPRTLSDNAISDVEIIVNGTTATRTDALIGAEYVLTVIKDETAEDFFSNDNLLYIDQKTADSSTVTFDFVLPEDVTDYTVKIFGVSHTHTPADVVKENEVSATCTNGGSYDAVTYCSVCGEEVSREFISTENFGHTAGTSVKENIVTPTCTANGGYDEVTYCAVCGDETSRVFVSEEKLGHTAGATVKENVVNPTCTAKGSYAEVVYCSVCTTEISREVVEVSEIEHNYKDGICTSCGDDKTADCSHMCHKSGFIGFIWKIMRFFFKLFKINPVCDCGVKHY